MNQVRLNKTPEIAKVLSFLQNRYHILSEAEIIKVALSEKYNKEVRGEQPNEYLIQTIKQAIKDRKMGKASPVFNTGKDAVKWLEQQGI